MRDRLTYANVMATVAVFIGLGGSAYAATHLDKNSVGSKQLRKGAVKASDLARDAVSSPNVADGSLLKADFGAGQIPTGPRGDRGETGPAGQDATKLFAYILDQGAASEATVAYGSGVTAVSDPAGESAYTVSFARDLTHCVAFATTGHGEPAGVHAGGTAFGEFIAISGSQVGVDLFDDTSTRKDGSFMIAALC